MISAKMFNFINTFFLQPVTLLLLDIPMMMPVMEGVVMELQDCALPLLHGKYVVSEKFQQGKRFRLNGVSSITKNELDLGCFSQMFLKVKEYLLEQVYKTTSDDT